nr:hypothetical protein BaRGS_030430 [Batillaria attramentaria]
MSAVAQELASIRQHQEQVRAELAVAKEEQDFLLTQKLTSELASLTTQQLQVLQEHSDALRKPRNRQHRSSRQTNGDDAFKGTAMGRCSRRGLRIAQQYGMADFARELQELQSQNEGPDESVGGGRH